MRGTNTKTKKDKQKLKYHIHVDGREFKVYETRTKRLQIHSTSFGKAADGTYIKRKFEADTLTELQAAVEDFINELNGKGGTKLTYYNACMEYIKTHSALLKPDTRNNYTDIANNRFKCLHNKPIMKLTWQDFLKAITEESEKNPAPSTMHTAITFMAIVCTEYEVPAMTPKKKRKLQNYGKTATEGNKGYNSDDDWSNAPSPFDVAKWAGENAAPDAGRTAISVLLDLHSLRSSETRGLRYSSVIEDNGKCYINIVRTTTVIRSKNCEQESTKNKGSKRKILIDRRLYDLIHSQPHQSEDEYVINVSYGIYADRLKKLIHAHTINGHSLEWITPHKLRHIFMTENAGNLVAEAVGGWRTGSWQDDNSVAKKDYTHVDEKQALKDKFAAEYSKKLLDSYEGITEPSITVTAGVAGTAEKSG